ncbi:uncharacterized protein LOC114732852 [Neltuma alba]|uniref:uncharacterized protein LOC114732852 n=1 Tax=Neltuma alba TaxID=207710 RepID=UPI0010A3DEDC|nr:uncharacterized protein LOC114732852 [Prosopis alba]XP_028776057.1 uncharacterized protein LOC114732852 [Prosopis alba]XP_028776058.1 uncharacterized protein LOC114732852 [Prosopis alba]XP_028776059.1 uncharacterized protein LOC114732852 [Prosopis alba]
MDPEEYLLKCSNMKCQRVQVDGSFVPAIQDESTEVEHLLAEPRNDHVSVDGILYFHEENAGKCCAAVDDLSRGFEFGLSTSIGGSDSHTTLNGKDDLKLEVLDGLLDDVEIDALNATDGFSCEDYLLDFEFADKAVGLCGESLVQSSSSESHSPGLSGSSNGVGGVPESSKVAIEQSEYKNVFLDSRVTHDLRGASRNSACQTSIEDGICNSLDMQHLNELDNDPPLSNSVLSRKKDKVSADECQTAAVREKRCRKPTLRYIEEFSNLSSKEKVLNSATNNKPLSLVSHHKLRRIRFRALRHIPGKNSDSQTSDMALPELQVHKRCLQNEELEYDEESIASESEDECVTPKRYRKNDRRKHQRMWTLSEVIKLVDGISEYGVGRWTDIKRVLFSSSSYRTPIDLRDKWRNLLRASSAHKFNSKETEQKQQHALRSLPSSVLRRVYELAKIHPYPRERNPNESSAGQLSSSILPTRTKDSPSKRNVRRKKCT